MASLTFNMIIYGPSTSASERLEFGHIRINITAPGIGNETFYISFGQFLGVHAIDTVDGVGSKTLLLNPGTYTVEQRDMPAGWTQVDSTCTNVVVVNQKITDCYFTNQSDEPLPDPTITSISPTSAMAGDPATTVTVYGRNFTANSVVWFGDTGAIATTHVSATELIAIIPETALVNPGFIPVSVSNSLSSIPSNAQYYFTVNPRRGSGTVPMPVVP
jgi:hypothetical protein